MARWHKPTAPLLKNGHHRRCASMGHYQRRSTSELIEEEMLDHVTCYVPFAKLLFQITYHGFSLKVIVVRAANSG